MLSRISQALWGKFESPDELKKFGLLGIIFGFIIAVYWALRPIKDSIFASMVGIDYQPRAKWLSLCIVIPLVILYGKLIDKYPRHKVFYFLTCVYGIAALGFAWAFHHPEIGLMNTVEDSSRMIGWAWYVYVESFGSLIVALFWAFTTDITTEDAAKRGFPLIALLGQTGNIFGPWLLRANRWGLPHSGLIVGVAGILMLAVGVMLWVFMRVVPKSQMVGFQEEAGVHHKNEEPGFAEGLKLLLTKGYLFGLFAIITIYEIIVTIFDFFFKTLAKQAYPLEKDMAEYLSNYAVMTGIVATLCVLLGINSIQRRLGMTASLILTPLLVAFAVVGLKFYPMLEVAFWIMVVAKAVNYALNQPTLKQLYIPTSKDAKYKSQAWIEMFGSRGAKAAGSYINDFRKGFITQHGALAGQAWFLTLSSMASLSMIVAWLFAVLFVAKTYNKAIAEKRVVC